jgi:hypothetical protein
MSYSDGQINPTDNWTDESNSNTNGPTVASSGYESLMPVYQWALSQGLSPVPVHLEITTEKGKGKAPSVAPDKFVGWKQYITKQPTLQQCQGWANTVPGLGCVVSGENVVIDIDFGQLKDDPEKRLAAIEQMKDGLIERCPILAKTYIQRSGSGGYHIFVNVQGGKHLGNGGTKTYNMKWEGYAEKVGELKKKFVVLAPSMHESGNRYEALNGLCDIVTVSLDQFDALGIYEVVPKQESSDRPAEIRSDWQVSTGGISLVDCLIGANQDRLRGIGLLPNRSDNQYAVAADAFNCQRFLEENSILYTGNADEIIQQMGEVLGYSESEAIRKAEKARNADPATPFKDMPARVGRLQKELRQQTLTTVDSKPSGANSAALTMGQSVSTVVMGDVDMNTAIADLRKQNLTGEDLETAIENIARIHYRSAASDYVQRVWDRYNRESVSAEENELYRASIIDELTHHKKQIGIREKLSQSSMFGAYLEVYSQQMGINSDYLLMAFLTAYGSILPKGLEYLFNQGDTTKPILFVLFVAAKSDGKGIYTNPFIKPLAELTLRRKSENKKLRDARQQKIDAFKALSKDEQSAFKFQWMADVENLPTKGKEGIHDYESIDHNLITIDQLFPEVPVNHQYVTKTFSPERLKSLCGEFNERGLLATPAEFTSVLNFQVKSQGKAAKSTNSEVLIDGFDGGTTSTDLQTDKDRPDGYFQFSILSGIQPAIFSESFDLADHDGLLSRFNYLPFNEGIIVPTNDDPDDLDILDLSEQFRLLVERTEESIRATEENKVIIKPTPEAKALWNGFYKARMTEANELKQSSEGLYGWLRRNPVSVARIALILHCFYYTEGLTDFDRIEAETMKDAIAIGEFLRSKAIQVFKLGSVIGLDQLNQQKREFFGKMLKLCWANDRNGSVQWSKIKNGRLFEGDGYRLFKAGWGKHPTGKRLGKPEIAAVWADMQSCGFGKFDPVAMTFEASIERF